MSTPTTRTLGRDDWMTPLEVFDPLHRVFHFTGDACATDREAARLDAWIDPVQDSLACSWEDIGPRVWCNPPYGRQIGRWFEHAVRQCETGAVDSVVMLTFANTDTRYWRDWVADCEWCHRVIFLRPRVRFTRPDGGGSVGAPKGSAVIVYRDHRRMHESRWPVHSYADWTVSNWPELGSLGE